MRRLLNASFVIVFAASLSFAQLTFNQSIVNTNPIQTGFAVVTPISGTGAGLSVSETFGEMVGGSLFQSSVLPSPLVTLTSMVVSADFNSGVDTGVALVNPTDSPGTVSFTLLNGQGAQVSIRAFTIGPRQQVSRFVTQVFAGVPEVEVPFIGQLFINSTVPIAVLGLVFNGPSFTSLPIATQVSANSIATVTNTNVSQPVTTVTTVNTVGTFNNTSVILPTTTIVTPQPTAFNTMTPLPSNIVGVPGAQSVTNITTPIDTVAVGTVGQFTTSPSAAVVVATTPTAALAIGTIPTVALAIGTTPTFTTFPQVSEVFGVTAALLPQIAVGGGWVSQITIANASTIAQTVRVDFFTPAGGPFIVPAGASSFNVIIPANGVATLSTGQ